MVLRSAVGLAALLAAAVPGTVAVAQQPANWQELALRAQQNATVDQMVANAMIAALQGEITELKAQLAKKDPPAAVPAPQPPMGEPQK